MCGNLFILYNLTDILILFCKVLRRSFEIVVCHIMGCRKTHDRLANYDLLLRDNRALAEVYMYIGGVVRLCQSIHILQ
jgi:hypothetical protein